MVQVQCTVVVHDRLVLCELSDKNAVASVHCGHAPQEGLLVVSLLNILLTISMVAVLI
jgi:hypothetical protein